mgnify:CR=1 FL=1
MDFTPSARVAELSGTLTEFILCYRIAAGYWDGFVPETVHARFGPMRRWGPIVQLAGGADSYGPGVLGGADTDRLLAELGYSTGDIESMRSARIVGSEAVDPFTG